MSEVNFDRGRIRKLGDMAELLLVLDAADEAGGQNLLTIDQCVVQCRKCNCLFVVSLHGAVSLLTDGAKHLCVRDPGPGWTGPLPEQTRGGHR